MAEHFDKLRSMTGIDADYAFWERYGTSPWTALRVDGRFPRRGECLLALSPAGAELSRRSYVAARRFSRSVKVGTVVFMYKNWLSFFDLDDFQANDVEVERIPSSGLFLQRLLARNPSRRR